MPINCKLMVSQHPLPLLPEMLLPNKSGRCVIHAPTSKPRWIPLNSNLSLQVYFSRSVKFGCNKIIKYHFVCFQAYQYYAIPVQIRHLLFILATGMPSFSNNGSLETLNEGVIETSNPSIAVQQSRMAAVLF